MAQAKHDQDYQGLEEFLKLMQKEQLLDCWEDSQHLAIFLEKEEFSAPPEQDSYERMILLELQLRTFQKQTLPVEIPF